MDDAAKKRKADLLKSVEAMDQKLQGIEHKFVSPSLLNSDDKYFVEPYQVYLNLIWLNAEVGTGAGDVAGGADFRPTDAQLVTLREQEAQMSAANAEFQKFLKNELPAFNQKLGENSLGGSRYKQWRKLAWRESNRKNCAHSSHFSLVSCLRGRGTRAEWTLSNDSRSCSSLPPPSW